MIIDEFQLRPRYGEVDQMGYVYHANYVTYCHQARTELLRKFGINDQSLEQHKIMLPVIVMNLNYLKPAYYDELLTVKTTIAQMPHVRFDFNFEILNEKSQKICVAHSTLVFADAVTRKPIRIPELVEKALKNHFTTVCV